MFLRVLLSHLWYRRLRRRATFFWMDVALFYDELPEYIRITAGKMICAFLGVFANSRLIYVGFWPVNRFVRIPASKKAIVAYNIFRHHWRSNRPFPPFPRPHWLGDARESVRFFKADVWLWGKECGL